MNEHQIKLAMGLLKATDDFIPLSFDKLTQDQELRDMLLTKYMEIASMILLKISEFKITCNN